MAQTSFPNTLIYECSSENASVKIAENEWINEFTEGIDLKPGDTIRILGSFINEKGQGDQIEITEENNKFTLEYMPIHNLYQYTKLSDDYTKPNDDTRTKVEKAQFSSLLNVDKPKFYDGNGSPIYTFPASKAGTDEATRAERWYDLLGWNTYNNISGYQSVNPNTQYYDCELIKNIACPHMDGIRLEWWDGNDVDNPNYIHQEIDFDISGANPWGGPISPYAGDDINGQKVQQLAFASQWVSFKWNGETDPTQASFTMELKDPFGVTGKVMGLRYTTNPLTYFDNYTDITFPKAAYPIATFMVGDHTQQTTIDPTMINPTGDDAKRMGKGFTIATSSSSVGKDFERIKNGPYYNASNGPVDKNGRTWGIGNDNAINIMFSGFTNGNEDKQDTPINYDFYCTGPNPYTLEMHNGDNGSNQSIQSPRVGIYYNPTSKKYYYQIRLHSLPGNADTRRFLDEYYYAFLRPYNPTNPQDTLSIGDRVYLPISIAIPELTFDTGKDPDTVLTANEIGEGTPRNYTTSAAGNDFFTGGMKLGNWGFSDLDDDSFKTICGDKYQQTIKPGFQTNVGMAILMSNQVKAQYGQPFTDPNFIEKVSRVAGGFPSTKYDEQLEDIRKYRQDCYLIQSKKANFEIPTGFYTSDRLANVINDLLHLNKEGYDKTIGKGQYTLSNKDNNWSYAPGNVNGPFMMTKIPEINGGIIPPDLSDENLNNPSLSKRMPGLTLDNTIHELVTDTINVDGKTAAQIATGIDNDDGTIFTEAMRNRYIDTGQMIFCPAPPSLIESYNTFEDESESRLLELDDDIISSNTPSLKLTTNFSKAWYDQCNGIAEREVPIFMGQGSYTAEGQKNDYSGTDFRPDKAGELGEGLIARVKNLPAGNVVTYDSPSTANTGYMFGFDPFANYNRTWGGLNTGGLSRFINGANDLTFLFDNDEERFAFSNSYTPFRPAGFESSKDKEEFTVDDAVPSALINTLYDGYNLYAITQIYILGLAAPPVSKTSSNVDNRQGEMPVVKDPLKQQAGAIELWESLGFTDLPSFTESDGAYTIDKTRWIDNLYFQEALDESTGKSPIFNQAEINPSANASNPSKSQCVITLPNRQFLIQTISTEFKANNPASLTTYPFYLIGSSIPSNFYHGSKTGTELPVVGLCSRNFSAGSFVFDLSQSSVEWTISENINLTSIRTKILKNDFSPATNLFGNSSIVYAITKANYYNEIPEPEATKIEEQREQDIEKELKAYENTPIPVQPPAAYIMPSVVYQELIDDDSD